MSSPGMSSGPDPRGGQGSQDVAPLDQAKGAVEIISKLRTQNQDQLGAIATQFPAVSKSANDLLSAFDRGLQGLIKQIIKTTQAPDPSGPRVVR